MTESNLVRLIEAIGEAKQLMPDREIDYGTSTTEDEMQLIDDFNDAIIEADMALHEAMEAVEGLMRRYENDN